MNSQIVKIFEKLVTCIYSRDYENIREIVIKYGDVDPEKISNIRSCYRLLSIAQIDAKKYNIDNRYIMYSLDYSKFCNTWGLLQRWSRGTYAIIDKSGGGVEVFFSFDKFFNLDENEEWSRRRLEKLRLVEVSRKCDGTLIIAFYSDMLGRWVLATRRIPHFYDPRTFQNAPIDLIVHPQISHALEIEPRLHPRALSRILAGLEDHVHMFEAVDPIRYMDETYNLGSNMAPRLEKERYVAYITARRLDDLYLLRYIEAHDMVQEFRKVEHVDARDLDTVMELVKRGVLGEGAVLRFEGDEVSYRLVKVKNVLVFRLNPQTITYAIIYGMIDDLIPEISRDQKLLEYAQEMRELVPRLMKFLKKFSLNVQELLKVHDIEKVRNMLKSMKIGILIEPLIEYLNSKITLEQLTYRIIRQLGFNTGSIRRLVERLDNFF
ncbi:MAG: hypothetical protein GXO26_08425 [Crenarchaeota archaeon]|nr:hypothetical protein [Thermoproteota archaeon]